ncbi:MAG: YqiJ family protein [Stappiaceae bacterium]
MEHLFIAENLPFSVALALTCLIAAVEGIGLILGLAPSEFVDSLLPNFDGPDLDVPDVDIPGVDAGLSGADNLDASGVASGGFFTKLLGWLNFGKVPALIWLVLFLSSFGLAGLVLQAVIKSFLGFYLPSALATAPALVFSLPVTSQLGKGLGKILPRDESEAVSRETFVGRIATIIRGTAAKGAPAEAKLTDQFNHTHYLLVVPDDDTESFPAGEDVVIVGRQANIFQAIRFKSDALSD